MTKPRLLIIGHANRQTGGLSVALNLFEQFVQYGQDFEILAVLPAECGYEPVIKGSNIRPYWFRQGRNTLKRFWFDTFCLPRIARSFGPDAILALGHLGYPALGGVQLVRFADAHYVYPKSHFGRMPKREILRYFVQGRQLRKTLDSAAVIYCQTETMAARLKNRFHPAGRIRILPNILPRASRDRSWENHPDPLSGYAGRFRMICLSRYYSQKNFEIFLSLYSRHRRAMEDTVLFLTLSPDQHPHAGSFLRQIRKQGLSEHLVNLGPIPQPRIGAYFSRCQALLFPTLMESFSATYLEAMHYQLPIITSDLDFAREICGPGALYCDPRSAESIRDCIVRLKTDPALRETLLGHQQTQAARHAHYTWAQNARQILSDIREHLPEPKERV